MHSILPFVGLDGPMQQSWNDLQAFMYTKSTDLSQASSVSALTSLHLGWRRQVRGTVTVMVILVQ